MPKRHRQPEPIQVSSAETRSSLPISTSFSSQTQESIEDYGDCLQERESCDSEEFRQSEMGDDGNVSTSTESLNDDSDSYEINNNNNNNNNSTSSSDEENSEDNENDDDDDDEENEDEDEDEDASNGLINVDFGVFGMRRRDVGAVRHLTEQLCPVNEGINAALLASPFTCVVKMGTDDVSEDDDEKEEEEKKEEKEEEEIYGMASILDVVHESRLSKFIQFLREGLWRTITPGIHPLEILTASEETSGMAKCVLLIGEYIRNVPLELTSHILDHVVQQFEAAANPKKKNKKSTTAPITKPQVVFPCMFAVLSKIQRAVDAPVTIPKKSKPHQEDEETVEEEPALKKKKKRHGAPQQEEFDISRYIFWREEDAIMYEYRDTRIATAAYRCHPQYDGQPENDIPISLLYVLPYGGLLQAVAEIKKRETTQANIVRY